MAAVRRREAEASDEQAQALVDAAIKAVVRKDPRLSAVRGPAPAGGGAAAASGGGSTASPIKFSASPALDPTHYVVSKYQRKVFSGNLTEPVPFHAAFNVLCAAEPPQAEALILHWAEQIKAKREAFAASLTTPPKPVASAIDDEKPICPPAPKGKGKATTPAEEDAASAITSMDPVGAELSRAARAARPWVVAGKPVLAADGGFQHVLPSEVEYILEGEGIRSIDEMMRRTGLPRLVVTHVAKNGAKYKHRAAVAVVSPAPAKEVVDLEAEAEASEASAGDTGKAATSAAGKGALADHAPPSLLVDFFEGNRSALIKDLAQSGVTYDECKNLAWLLQPENNKGHTLLSLLAAAAWHKLVSEVTTNEGKSRRDAFAAICEEWELEFNDARCARWYRAGHLVRLFPGLILCPTSISSLTTLPAVSKMLAEKADLFKNTVNADKVGAINRKLLTGLVIVDFVGKRVDVFDFLCAVGVPFYFLTDDRIQALKAQQQQQGAAAGGAAGDNVLPPSAKLKVAGLKKSPAATRPEGIDPALLHARPPPPPPFSAVSPPKRPLATVPAPTAALALDPIGSFFAEGAGDEPLDFSQFGGVAGDFM